MPEFHETIMGKRFYEGQLPELIRQLTRIADALGKDKKQTNPRYGKTKPHAVPGIQEFTLSAKLESYYERFYSKYCEDNNLWLSTHKEKEEVNRVQEVFIRKGIYYYLFRFRKSFTATKEEDTYMIIVEDEKYNKDDINSLFFEEKL